MEITLEAIISFIGLFISGGAGAFFTWKWQKRKAKAEAEKEEQGYYQQMMADIARDRDYYKQERNEYRQTIKSYDERIDTLERAVARNGRMVEAMRPFMCADLACKLRKRVVVSAEGEVKQEDPQRKRRQPKNQDIEPLNQEDL